MTVALPPDHDMGRRHSPGRSLSTECVTKNIIHVLGFTVVGSIVVFVDTDIDSLSFTVWLKTNMWSWKITWISVSCVLLRYV